MTLTHEDIDNMEAGREMDALVAELVMEWSPTSGYEWRDKHGEYTAGRAWHHDHTFEPSTDIAAAWQVENKIGLLDAGYSIEKDKNYQIGHYGDYGFDVWTVFAEAPTIELAICRAALKEYLRRKEG